MRHLCSSFCLWNDFFLILLEIQLTLHHAIKLNGKQSLNSYLKHHIELYMYNMNTCYYLEIYARFVLVKRDMTIIVHCGPQICSHRLICTLKIISEVIPY